MAQEPPGDGSLGTRHWPLVLVRIIIGWHFLYEAFVKILFPGWTSAGYLKSSTGPLAGFFFWLGSDDTVVRVIDQLNLWALLLAGLALMLGVFVRPAAVTGMVLLALYYLSHPPLFSPVAQGYNEGSYLIINKNLVEFFTLLVIATSPLASLGLASLPARLKKLGKPPAGEAEVPRDVVTQHLGPIPRRQVFASLAGVPFLGALVLAALKKHGWQSIEETHLAGRRTEKDVFAASATIKSFRFSTRGELKGTLPVGQIGNVRLSRMILGGNLIGGWAHARDLIYVSKLVRAYHHRDKIFETLALAESCGVNTIITNPILCATINDYWRAGGRIQFISDSGGKDLLEMIRKSVDTGACSCYIHGGVADRLVELGQFDLIAKGLDLIRKNGLPAGIAGHKLATVRGCVEKGLKPDYWMKTLHRVDYWSAKREPENDNTWCESPEETAAFMTALPQPWIAYKTLAAGAIKPETGFRFAFESGADFICVGMYDFQVVDDVNIALAVLNGTLVRPREWRA